VNLKTADWGGSNADFKVNVSLVNYLISYLIKGGPAPVFGLCTGNDNYDDYISFSEVVFLINYLFKGGPPPAC